MKLILVASVAAIASSTLVLAGSDSKDDSQKHDYDDHNHGCVFHFACMDLQSESLIITLFLLGLVFFSSIFEHLLKSIRRYIHRLHEPIYRKVFHLGLEEITVTGALSFVLFIAEVYEPAFFEGPSHRQHELKLYFEFVHMSVLITVLIYGPFVLFLAYERSIYVKEWNLFEQILHDSSLRSHLKGNGVYTRFGAYKAAKTHLLKFYNLRPDFPFVKYLAHCFDELFAKLCRLGWMIAVVMFVWMRLAFFLAPYLTMEHEDPYRRNEYLFYSGALVNWAFLALFSISSIILTRIQTNIEKESKIADGEELRSIHRTSIVLNTKQPEMELESISTFSFQEMESKAQKQRLHSPDIPQKFLTEDWNDNYKRNAHWTVSWFPFIFERDPYRRQFPFSSPDSFLRLFQLILIFQAVFLCWFAFVFAFLRITSTIWIPVLGLIPSVILIFFLAPRSLQQLAIVRYSGPIARLPVIESLSEASGNKSFEAFHGHLENVIEEQKDEDSDESQSQQHQ